MRLILAVLVCTILAFAALATMRYSAHGDFMMPSGIYPTTQRSLPHSPSTSIPSQPGVGGCGGCL